MPREYPDSNHSDLNVVSCLSVDDCGTSVNPAVVVANVQNLPDDEYETLTDTDQTNELQDIGHCRWKSQLQDDIFDNFVQPRLSMFAEANKTMNLNIDCINGSSNVSDSYDFNTYDTDVKSRMFDMFDSSQNRAIEVKSVAPSRVNSGEHVEDRKKESGTGSTRKSIGQFFCKMKHKKKHQPTYRMGPMDNQRINYCAVKSIMDEVTNHALLAMPAYDPYLAGKVIKQIVGGIVSRVKLMNVDRYKLMCHVTLVELRGQAVMIGSRHVWCEETDKVITVRRGRRGERGPFEMIVTLYAMYRE